MVESAPRVGIGIPVYNGERFLAEALDSLLAQTYRDFELIISDNGSTDGTPDICRDYAAVDDRIGYHRQDENRGAAWNFNQVFHLSRGEYFKWAADDDICAPTYLERCVEVLDQHPDVIWCHSQNTHIDPQRRRLYGDVSYVDPDPRVGSLFDRWRATAATRGAARPDQRFRSVLLGQENKDVFGLIRADAMRKTSLQLPVYGGDKVFVAELSLLGRFHEIPEILFFSRYHPTGSGALATASDQQRWIDPSQPPRAVRLRLLRAHARAIRRTPMGVADKLLCYLVLLRYLLQFRKWRSLISKSFAGVGTGGGYLDAARNLEVQQQKEQDFSSRVTATADSRRQSWN